MSWVETYRGVVNRWEVDNVDHFTVAFYFARFEDAALDLSRRMGLDPESLQRSGRATATLSCRVRYLRELRLADILHIRSGVVGLDGDLLVLAHELYDSGDGTLCTTLEQRVALVEIGVRAPLPLGPAERDAALARRVEWSPAPDGPPFPEPVGAGAFIDATRDIIRPGEVDASGQATLAAFVHRFSSAIGHVIAGFGMTPAYMRDERRGFSTFEFRLRFPGTARAGDAILVRSALVHIGNSSVRILHRMTNQRTGGEVASLEQSGVHLDLDARRPSPLPESLRERAKEMLGAAHR